MDIKEVEKLALLARIDLPQEEKEQILKDMQGILEYVKQIEALKVPEVKIVPEISNVWRADEIKMPLFSRELIIKQFPDSLKGYLKVKKIL